MELYGARIALRPLGAADVTDAYVGWLNDPVVNRYLDPSVSPATRESVARYLRRFERGTTDQIFAVVERASGAHVGNVTLNRIDPVRGTTDTGLLIGDRSKWGRGYAYEAWSLAIAHAFAELGVRKVIAGAVSQNVASVAVLRKLGFSIEGVLRREAPLDGGFVDVIRFGLFAAEFTPATSARATTRVAAH